MLATLHKSAHKALAIAVRWYLYAHFMDEKTKTQLFKSGESMEGHARVDPIGRVVPSDGPGHTLKARRVFGSM